MARPSLRRPGGDGSSLTPSPATAAAPATFTLAIAGVVVTRAQFVVALQPFPPQLADIQPFEDGERFLFVFNPQPTAGSPVAAPEP